MKRNRFVGLVWGGVLVALVCAQALAAQSANDFLNQGVRAYQNLDYDLAATMLRRSLTPDSGSPLPDSTRVRALCFLGATELLRGHRDAGVAAFRTLVQLDPRYRPDELVFPPRVTNVYQQVRRETKTFTVEAPPITEIRARLQRFTARLYSSAPTDVTVTLVRPDGVPVRKLYSGPVEDSLAVMWDGLTAAGAPPEDGTYVLRVATRATEVRAARALSLPLEIKQLPTDTIAWPTRPATLPERTPTAPALRALGAGVVAGAAALLLPSVMARGTTASDARFAVGIGLGVTGVMGFVLHRPGRPIDANIASNSARRTAWQQRVMAVRAENADRRSTARLEIRAGPAAVAVLGAL